jgi:hypothetical protein
MTIWLKILRVWLCRASPINSTSVPVALAKVPKARGGWRSYPSLAHCGPSSNLGGAWGGAWGWGAEVSGR